MEPWPCLHAEIYPRDGIGSEMGSDWPWTEEIEGVALEDREDPDCGGREDPEVGPWT